LSLPVFLRGMLLLLAAFGIVGYAITGSGRTVLANSMLCALLLQAGYFVVVLFIVWSGGRKVRSCQRRQPTSR
jgi:exopolysaccharide production repressor protein